MDEGKTYVILHEFVEANGKTIRENNLARPHNIPIDTLVEVKFDDWFGDGGGWKVHARLWVISHDRDCDGTPLYSLSRWRDEDFARHVYARICGMSEERLTVVSITPELLQGENALEWNEESQEMPTEKSSLEAESSLPMAHNLNILYVGRHVFSIDGVSGFFSLKKPSPMKDNGPPVHAVYCRGKGTSRIGHDFYRLPDLEARLQAAMGGSRE